MTKHKRKKLDECKADIESARGAGMLDGVIWRGMRDKYYCEGCIIDAFAELGPRP